MTCPCNPNKDYRDCCEKVHLNSDSALTAEALMRSRYSAFVLGHIAYLQKSHHKKTRPSKREKKELLQWATSVEWVKLIIIDCKAGRSNDTKGYVEFKAVYIEDGKLEVIHENSYFLKVDSHWVYVSGQHVL